MQIANMADYTSFTRSVYLSAALDIVPVLYEPIDGLTQTEMVKFISNAMLTADRSRCKKSLRIINCRNECLTNYAKSIHKHADELQNEWVVAKFAKTDRWGTSDTGSFMAVTVDCCKLSSSDTVAIIKDWRSHRKFGSIEFPFFVRFIFVNLPDYEAGAALKSVSGVELVWPEKYEAKYNNSIGRRAMRDYGGFVLRTSRH